MSKVLVSFTGRVPREVFLVQKAKEKGKADTPKPTLYLRPNNTATVEKDDLPEIEKQLGRDARFLRVHTVAPDAKPKGKVEDKGKGKPEVIKTKKKK